MSLNGVDIPDHQLVAFCRRHGVRRLAVYGSILRDDFGPDSDIDFLIDFLPGETPSLFDVGGMLMELRAMLGREVDLRTPMDLSPYFREDVVSHAKTLYAT